MPPQGWTVVEESEPKGWTRVDSSAIVDPTTGTEYQPGAMARIPSRSLTTRGSIVKTIRESEANQAESNRLAAEHPILTTAALVAAGGGAGLVRAATMRGAPIAARAVAAGKAIIGGAMPIVKYEVAKNALEAIGVPPSIASTAAAIATAYGGKGAAKTEEPTAPTAAKAPATEDSLARMNRIIDDAKAKPVTVTFTKAPAAESAPEPTPAPAAKVAPTPTPAPTAPKPAPTGPSPQQIRNDVGLAYRRAKPFVKLTDEQLEQADALVAKGTTPQEAIAKITETAKPAETPKPAASVPPAGMKMSAAEAKEYVRVVKAGKTQAEAVDAIKALRKLAGVPGAMTTEQMESEIAARVGNRSPKR